MSEPVLALVQPAAIQAYADAEQFGKVLQRNWEGGLLVARSATRGQGQRTDLLQNAGSKIPVETFARQAKADPRTIKSYLDAWAAAAEDGLVPTADDLRPGEDVVLPDERWDDYYGKKMQGNYERNAAGAHEGANVSDEDSQGDGWKLLLGDFRDRLADLPCGSVNLIVTDPPYPEEYLPLWEDLAREASRLLISGGILAARCGHLYLPQVLNMLGGSLQYGWTYAEPLPGSNVRFLGRKIAVAYQPWVAFSNGPWPSGATDWHPDMLEESPRTKARYVWEQKPSVAAEVTATFAGPGNDVLDPFAGSGTYGVAALGVGCRWIGVELDAAGHAQATKRLREIAA